MEIGWSKFSTSEGYASLFVRKGAEASRSADARAWRGAAMSVTALFLRIAWGSGAHRVPTENQLWASPCHTQSQPESYLPISMNPSGGIVLPALAKGPQEDDTPNVSLWGWGSHPCLQLLRRHVQTSMSIREQGAQVCVRDGPSVGRGWV